MTAAFDEFQRELIVENTRAGLNTARKKGRKGGRPLRMTKDKIRAAEAMLKDTDNYILTSDIIAHLGVGRTTFYRQFQPELIKEKREGRTP